MFALFHFFVCVVFCPFGQRRKGCSLSSNEANGVEKNHIIHIKHVPLQTPGNNEKYGLHSEEESRFVWGCLSPGLRSNVLIILITSYILYFGFCILTFLTFLSVWMWSSSLPAEVSVCYCTAARSDTSPLQVLPVGRSLCVTTPLSLLCVTKPFTLESHPQWLHQLLQTKSFLLAAPPVLLQLLPQVRVSMLDLTELQQSAGKPCLQLWDHAL